MISSPSSHSSWGILNRSLYFGNPDFVFSCLKSLVSAIFDFKSIFFFLLLNYELRFAAFSLTISCACKFISCNFYFNVVTLGFFPLKLNLVFQTEKSFNFLTHLGMSPYLIICPLSFSINCWSQISWFLLSDNSKTWCPWGNFCINFSRSGASFDKSKFY